MGRDRHKLLWDGNGTDEYVPWTTLVIRHNVLLDLGNGSNRFWESASDGPRFS